jgi:hypothetical protein
MTSTSAGSTALANAATMDTKRVGGGGGAG